MTTNNNEEIHFRSVFWFVLLFAFDMIFEWLRDMKSKTKSEDSEEQENNWLDSMLKIMPTIFINMMAFRSYSHFCGKMSDVNRKEPK